MIHLICLSVSPGRCWECVSHHSMGDTHARLTELDLRSTKKDQLISSAGSLPWEVCS